MNRNLIAYFHLCLSIFLKNPQKIKDFIYHFPFPPLLPLSLKELAWLDSHRLHPLTYWLYQQVDQSPSLDHSALESLALAYWQQQKKQLQLMALLSKQLTALAHQPILIKGAQTHISLWQSSGVRTICDYDLLIHQADLSALKQHCHESHLKWEEEYESFGSADTVMTACLRKKDLLIECHLSFMPPYLPKLDYHEIHHQALGLEHDVLKTCFIPTAIDQWLIYVANQAKNGFYAFDLLDILEGLLLINQLIACHITPLACDQRIKAFSLQPSAFLVLSQLLVFLEKIKAYHVQVLCEKPTQHAMADRAIHQKIGVTEQPTQHSTADVSTTVLCQAAELTFAFDQLTQWIQAEIHLSGVVIFKPKFDGLSMLLSRQLYERKFLITTRLFKFLIWEIGFQMRMLTTLLKALKKHLARS